MKILIALLPALAIAACAEASAAPEPQPDPAEVERLLAAMERQAAAEGKVQEKIRKAEPLVATAERAEPDRLAMVAERLLAP